MIGRITAARQMLPVVFFISFATIGWQLVLMRCLLIARYHHFSFLVISCALLGFGAGGTILSLRRSWFEDHVDAVLRWGALLFAVSMPVCFRVGELLPLSVYFPPAEVIDTLRWWFLFWLIHVIPFLMAGVLIGLALMAGGVDAYRVYAANLAGSAAGALGGIWLLEHVPANGAVAPLSGVVLISGFFLLHWRALDRSLTPLGRAVENGWNRRARPALQEDSGPTMGGRAMPAVTIADRRAQWIYGTSLLGAGLLLGGAEFLPADKVFPLNVDQYKTLAYVQRLTDQGSAERKASFFSLRGRIDLFSSSSFHTLMSLNSPDPPPPMDVLLQDGFQAGSIPRVSSADQARFLESTLSALPYKLVRPERVLILGDAGGIYVWLARLSSAESIVTVQPDKNIVRVLQAHPSRVLDDPRVSVMVADPRAFLDQTNATFDIIHLASLEGFTPGSGGIGGLREDYLSTVEGFERCLALLGPRGMASVTRGIQDPPRDNLKIAATWVEALGKGNVRSLSEHLLMARDELNLTTLAAKNPLDLETVRKFQETCRSMSWDIEWFPGIRPEQTNRVHILPGPEGSRVSWYYDSMNKLLSGKRAELYQSWIAQIKPATDNQPFFHDFFRWKSVFKLREVFGPLWPTRAEMGFLVLIISFIWTAGIAVLLLPPAACLLRRAGDAPSVGLIGWVVVFFGSLGAGFMFLEMTFIQIFTRFLGDPVLAAGTVFGGFLLFAGSGSMVQPRVTRKLPGGILFVAISIALIVLVDFAVFPHIFAAGAGLSSFSKALVSLGLMAPLAFLMGMPFPWGLSALHIRGPGAIPLAWAVNGFASVVSTSAAVLVSMAYGFSVLLGLSASIYAFAGVLSCLLGKLATK